MTQAAAAAFLMLVLLFGGPWVTVQSTGAPEPPAGAHRAGADGRAGRGRVVRAAGLERDGDRSR